MTDLELSRHDLIAALGPVPPLSRIATPDEYRALAEYARRIDDAADWFKTELLRAANQASGPDCVFAGSRRFGFGDIAEEAAHAADLIEQYERAADDAAQAAE